jgi:23S rRNA (adenine2503-C2)-methyltransferase
MGSFFSFRLSARFFRGKASVFLWEDASPDPFDNVRNIRYSETIMQTPQTRQERFAALFPEATKLRFKQMREALFRDGWKGWDDVSILPVTMRETLRERLPWLSCRKVAVLESRKRDTFKAVLETEGGHRIETVLMRNARNHWTVCVSSQVGCAMACTFCATGKMGFSRNLTEDEIVDQYRFWRAFLSERPNLSPYISNIVFMGMGEPLANYENVKAALRSVLEYTDLGPTRITVSTVGLVPMLEKLLVDSDWPAVRLAVSLHSADSETRKEIMPSSYDGFLDRLADWACRYFAAFGSRRRHLTFEYVMLSGVNDTPRHAEALWRFAHRIGKVRVNLIPYNFTGSRYVTSGSLPAERFQEMLERKGVTVTRRRTMGDDIAAACGQLIVEGVEGGAGSFRQEA